MKRQGEGLLNYRHNNLVVEVNKDLTAYYRWLVGNRVILLKPSFGSHITVCKGIDEAKKYQNERVEFEYSHLVRISGDTTGQDRPDSYYFLDVWCPRLIDIREDLGLPTYFKFHLTIGRLHYLL
jgi:hypothetical protein